LTLAGLGLWMGLSWPYWAGLIIVAGLLTWEHSLVRPDDLSKINLAFFNINSYISITLFLSILGALYIS
jgi:4-hydroxybenzoate polyprenyltransferase